MTPTRQLPRGKRPRERRRPAPPAPQTLRRILLGLLTVACLFVASWARITPPRLNLVEGDITARTIRAPRSGSYRDDEETARLRAAAAEAVSEVYLADPNASRDALTALDDIFARLAEVRADPALTTTEARLGRLRDLLDIRLGDGAMQLLVAPSTSESVLKRLREAATALVVTQMSTEIRANGTDLRVAQEALTAASGDKGLNQRYASVAAELGRVVLKPNRRLDAEATARAILDKQASVKDVVRYLQPGDVIILAGQEVSASTIAAFQAVGLIRSTVDYTQAAGVLLTLLLLTLGLGLFTRRFVKRAYGDFGQLLTVAALLVVAAATFRALEPTSWYVPGAVTVAVAITMLVALVVDVLVALATSAFLATLVPVVVSGSDARMSTITFLCAAAGAMIVSRRGRKSNVIGVASPLLAVLNAALIAAGAEVFGLSASLRDAVIAAVGGLAAPPLALGAAVAWERFLGVTTDFRLMELGNPTEPILQRLMSQAPGSYQSSVMVGNLAEPAAEAIDANALLVRTGAMYHDIGKIRRPFFFVENQFGTDNPHDRLSPHLSARVIVAHVKDGLEVADEYQVPPALRDFIAQHHGTTLVRYFYQRALEAAPDPAEVREEQFRYPGPKPQTRETALFMLADTVEAAVRTLDHPTPAELEEMVDRLVDDKIRDRQLDECPLTLRDVTLVKQSFVSTLTSVYHQRIRYPEPLEREGASASHASAAPGVLPAGEAR
jgi:cyclic-di-AMP phosphodiesterase PgpH